MPILYDNETLYSWCAMVHALNGRGSAIDTSIALFGSPSAARLHDFPSHLGTLTRRFESILPDARRLALRHTLLGFFLPFQSQAASEDLLCALYAGAVPSIKMRLGITASRVGGYHPLKSCRKCMQDDCNRTGIAYWHTEHQWPSAMVCVTHERPLVITWDPITPVHRREWLVPGHCPKAALIETPILDDSQIGRLLQLAEFSKYLACSEPGAFDPRLLARTYQARLRNLGLASARGNLKLKLLLDVTRGRYSGIESVPGFESLQAIGPDWPGLIGTLSRRTPKPGHPLKHLLMIAMLFESWEEFLEAYSNAASDDEAPASVGPSQHNEDSREEMLYRLVAHEGRSIREAALCLHISTTTGAQMARRLGIAFTPRPKQMTPERVRRIKRLLRTGASTRDVATQSSVSVGSINRLLAADEHLRDARKMKLFLAKRLEARKAFCGWARRFPGHQVNELRKMPGNPYTWLYRHDGNWLREQIPSLWTVPSRVKNV